MILAIDPGGKPGYVLLDTRDCRPRRYFGRALPRVVAAWRALPPAPLPALIRAVVIEGQWLFDQAKKSATLTLALRAGWQLRAAVERHGGAPYVVTPQDWRRALGSGSTTKEVLAARAAAALDEISGLTADQLDAILIGWGWSLLRPTPTPWKVPP